LRDFTESVVENATSAWLQPLGYPVLNGCDIATALLERGLRDGLLPKLLSGAIRLRNMERFAESKDESK
jgi:hypothetical protein